MSMEDINLYSIDYYKKTVFKGSYQGMCFRIGRMELPVSGQEAGGSTAGSSDGSAGAESGAVDGGEEMTDALRVQAWKGPYILEKTDEEIFTEYFDYSDEGLARAKEWLEEKQKDISF